MPDTVYPTSKISELANAYLAAKELVIEGGYEEEIEWQNSVRFCNIRESDFLRETGWVVLSCGMRERVVRRKFHCFSEAFYDWKSSSLIADNAHICRSKALSAFRHEGKVDAVITIARQVSQSGFDSFKQRIEDDGVEFIRRLPFMGPATSYHLAKNIGLDVVKPDRHLVRVASATGYDSPTNLCKDIASLVGDRISVIDLVIWRFATLAPNYVDFFSEFREFRGHHT